MVCPHRKETKSSKQRRGAQLLLEMARDSHSSVPHGPSSGDDILFVRQPVSLGSLQLS